MHELSIAISIVEGITEEAQSRRLGRIVAIHLKLGALSGVIKDALLFGYDAASQGTPLEGSRLIVQEVPVVIFCSRCRAAHRAVASNDLRCAACGELSAEVVSGRELEVVALELASSEEEGNLPPAREEPLRAFSSVSKARAEK